MARVSTVKTLLWAAVGVLGVVTAIRFLGGLGITTRLSDAVPWGFWIAFDVMSGVALAAGGFVLAATVYIFGLERYRPFVRPAILTALLGYVAVAVGLLYDLGLPWHIWHPIIYPQHHSVLFEVAMCVMLYLTVLSLEFLPVILEHSWFDRPLFRAIHRALKGAVIPLVIAGIVLSTLHQSSLGSLFLIAPYRLHPLWYSPIIWVLFLVSAVGLGLMMVTAESFFSAWLFGQRLPVDRLAGLGRAASVVLFFYAALRLGDLAMRGVLGQAFAGSWQAWWFWGELLTGALVPATLLQMRRVRSSRAGLATCAALAVLGLVGYRFDVCIVAFARPEGVSYFPSWMELAVSIGIVAGAMLVFIFFVERLDVWGHDDDGDRAHAPAQYHPETTSSLLPPSLDGPRRYSLAALVGASLAMAMLPGDLFSGGPLLTTRVFGARSLPGWMRAKHDGRGYDLGLLLTGDGVPAGAERVRLMMIDGNRDGRLVLFPHKHHVETLGDQRSCPQCHHLNLPFDQQSSCFECHRDMYLRSDIFDHDSHVRHFGGNKGCGQCHRDSSAVKKRATARPCVECHADMMAEGALVELPKDGIRGFAVGYMQAMHGVCAVCHRRKWDEDPEEYGANFAECSNCHREADGTLLRQTKPYAIAQEEP